MILPRLIISFGIAIGVTGCATSPSMQVITAREAMNDPARLQQSETIMASFESLVGCVKRRATMLALEPDPADTLARAALSGCSQLHSGWTHAVMQARDLLDEDHARLEIDHNDAKLRDVAVGIIIDLRARARQTPRPTPTPAFSRNII